MQQEMYRGRPVNPEIRFNEATGHVVVTVGDTMSVAEFVDAMERITSSGEFPSNTDTIWDLRRLDPNVLTESYLRRIVDARARFSSRYRTRVAHVADSPLAYGMLRMYEALSEVSDAIPERYFAVFRTIEEAEAWLAEAPPDL